MRLAKKSLLQMKLDVRKPMVMQAKLGKLADRSVSGNFHEWSRTLELLLGDTLT